MSRKRRSAAFSLFSFQDIITAVTAILILILLIMTLSLIETKRSAGAADGAVSRQMMDDVIDRLSQRSEELARQKESADQSNQDSRTKEAITQEIAIEHEEVDSIRSKLNDAEQMLKVARRLEARVNQDVESRREDFEALTQAKDDIVELNREIEGLREENKNESERLNQLKKEVPGRPVGNEMVFNSSDKNGLQAWLINVSSEGLVAVKLGGGAQDSLGEKVTDPSFQQWLAARRSATDHCLLLVRPSGVDLLNDLESELSAKSILYGVDLIAEDIAIRDGLAESAKD